MYSSSVFLLRITFATVNNPILCVQHLSVDFKTEEETVHAIQDISFDLYSGQTLALVGESGSGKSVSALSILGLLPFPQAKIIQGKIQFLISEKEQINLLSCPKKTLESLRGKKIGMIFQEPMTSLNPLMRCGEQVMETIIIHKKISREKAREETICLFEEVRLPVPVSIMERYPHELSGGQKQRVMIAIAICCNPSILIADEPTTALDVTVQKTILDLLKDLQEKRGMAILFITHDLNLVRNFAERVMVMYKGKSVEYGTTKEIFLNPTETYTRGLLNCRPSKTERVRFLKTVQEVVEEKTIYKQEENTISESDFEQRLRKLQIAKPIIELKNLVVHYPIRKNFFGKTTTWFEAVNGVSLLVREGETMGLVGESGCGKTTIGKSIVQLAKITNGEILYKGKNIMDFTGSELAAYQKDVQIIFQDPYSSLNPRIPIGEAIIEPMDVHGLHNSRNRKEQVMELLTMVGLLPSHYNRYPHEFSGGQRQRICIGRALALQPSFLICDESVSALDVSIQAQVLNLLVSLRDEFQLSYLFISHDLGVVKHISDHVAVMQKGKIVELNSSEKIYHSPNDQYTKQLIESSL